MNNKARLLTIKMLTIASKNNKEKKKSNNFFSLSTGFVFLVVLWLSVLQDSAFLYKVCIVCKVCSLCIFGVLFISVILVRLVVLGVLVLAWDENV